jgi:hypothetical protein
MQVVVNGQKKGDLPMTRATRFSTCLSVLLCASASFAQSNVSESAAAPAAYVYLTATAAGGSNQVWAYSASTAGALTAIPGSPFAASLVSTAVTGSYLFGINTNGTDVDSYSIAANGSIKLVSSINAESDAGGGCNGLGPLILDHTGATLYVAATVGGDCDQSEYLSFSINKKSGELTFLGSTSQTNLFNSPLSFLGNNKFAYGTDCINFQGEFLDTFAGAKRESTGMLNYVNVSLPTPTAKNGNVYCRDLTATDPDSHVAVALLAISGGSTVVGSPQLATYTADSSGNLTTKSTASNMPTTKVLTISTLAASPSGKLLAVAGGEGLEILHFNGSSPLTKYTGLLSNRSFTATTPSPGLAFWDNSNHLYAISPGGDQKLRIFLVTPTEASLVKGTPFSVPGVLNISVLPK